MSSELNLIWEEYKLLKEEARSFTNVTFRDLQLIVTFMAAFVALMVTVEGQKFLHSFLIMAIAEAIAYVFLLIQLSRLAYLATVRKHLSKLEHLLSKESDLNRLRWESEIVPNRIANPKSLNAQSKALIAIVYILGFLYLSQYSLGLSQKNAPDMLYLCIIYAQYVTFIYMLGRLLFQNGHRKRSKEKRNVHAI